MKTDVCIVGGGLAGLAAAALLAGRGYAVAVVEQGSYPRHKVCGEYVAAEAWPLLRSLGISPEELELPVIDQLTVSDLKGNTLKRPLNPGGVGISRYLLDELLYKAALAKGVTLFTQQKVHSVLAQGDGFVVSSEHQHIEALVVIGAWGKRSGMDQQLKRPFFDKKSKAYSYVAVKYHLADGPDKDRIELHNFRGGYAGISAVEDGRYCLCYMTTAEALASCGHSIEAMEEKLLSQNPYLHTYLRLPRLYDKPLVISQVSFAPKETTQNGILMAGDTAGLIAPLCGNGMSMALHAAVLADGWVSRFLSHDISRAEMEGGYSREWKKLFSLRLSVGKQLQALLGNPLSTSLALSTLSALPSVADGLIRLTHGKPFLPQDY